MLNHSHAAYGSYAVMVFLQFLLLLAYLGLAKVNLETVHWTSSAIQAGIALYLICRFTDLPQMFVKKETQTESTNTLRKYDALLISSSAWVLLLNSVLTVYVSNRLPFLLSHH
jgi:hypothetical protein